MASANGPSNGDVARVLERVAELLETQEANPFRVQAYRNGAQTVRSAERSVAEIVREEGRDALRALPGIGRGLAATIAEFVQTGRLALLSRLQGEASPEELFSDVPGIGVELAERIVDQLGIHSLEELELAAHDGRLERVEGFGPKRVEAVRLALAGMLTRSALRRSRESAAARQGDDERPDVGTLLAVDAEYRARGEAGELPTIAPRRFNPRGEAWLPVLHTEREGWQFTALYSNTARAHELGKTRDWVVIYYERDGRERQATVVTATSGPLQGKRVVRGREAECRRYYAQQEE